MVPLVKVAPREPARAGFPGCSPAFIDRLAPDGSDGALRSARRAERPSAECVCVGIFQQQWQTYRIISRTLAMFFTICGTEPRFSFCYQH